MKSGRSTQIAWAAVVWMTAILTSAQTAYTPKFPGDPARSDSEAAALGYMRTVLRAQKEYKTKHGDYAKTLAELAHTPKQLDPEHRSFYAKEDGVIHADEEKAASESSPRVK